jgi:hypothetical protein
MMIKFKAGLIGILWLFADLVIGSPLDSRAHFFGASISGFSGSGLTYRIRIGDNYSIKTAGYFIFFDKDSREKGDEVKKYNFGLECQRNFFKKKYIRFYGCLGSEYSYSSEAKAGYDNIENKNFQTGAGFGIDLNASLNQNYPDFVLFIDIGEKYYSCQRIRWSDEVKIDNRLSRGFDLTGTVGLGVEF